jgi:TPR repeat protein
MADVAHDASGPKAGDIAPQQASRPDSPDRGKLRVFISYSREDLYFADQLNAALDACGFECFIDRHGISGGEDWKRRLGNLIREADTVVFVLSPTSARSEICAWEVEEATRLGKRILPVNCEPLKDSSPPPRLRDLNYIFFHADPKTPDLGFGTGLAKLIAALNTDFDWLREHTRYLQRATEWDRGGRPANRLLSGDDIAEAKAWAARRPKNAPEPTALHLDFIRASEEEAEARSSAQRKQLAAMAAAQVERETALREAEEAQRKRATMARIRNIALVAVSILAVLAGWLGLRSEQQRKLAEVQRAVAEEQREQADRILEGATSVIRGLAAAALDRMELKTKKQVFAVLKLGADHGDATSISTLGWVYHTGFGVEQDYAKARELYEKAAEKGKPATAMTNLGWLYQHGQGVEQDYAKAHEWYEKAADKGEENAMANLGVLYAQGLGVEQDYVKARELFEKAADKGDPTGMNGLGWLYQNGQGVTQDYAKARELFEKAADKDEENAMNSLGWLYQHGQGVEQDYAKAREWYEKAAAKDNVTAMNSLGWLYRNGHGVAQDYARAREWYEKAAEKGDVNAMVNLGVLYANGQGVEQDYVKAREWYEKAAEKGDAIAVANLENLLISEAAGAGRYAEALHLQEALTARVEEVETKREGKPGKETAQVLNRLAEYALFAREFAKALTVAERAHALLPDNLYIETNRAHALLFMEHEEEAKALYLAYEGKPLSGQDAKLWERGIAEDFAEFRKAGLTHPMMADIEKELGVSR